MKLLADENFPWDSVEYLRQYFDVKSIQESHSGIDDEQIIHLSNQEQRIILTFDRDFGQLIFKQGIIPKQGIVYFRLESFMPDEPGKILHQLLQSEVYQVENSMIVIDKNHIRQKRF